MKFIPKFLKKNTLLRKFEAILAHIYFGFPARKLVFIGVTGTSGKTTTTFLVQSILEEANFKTGLIGTAGAYWNNEVIYGETFGPATTPDPFLLHRILKNMVNKKVKVVVIEVSSSALDYYRTYGINFKSAILTNLEFNYHIGTIHKNMESYVNAKLKLFKSLSSQSLAVLPKNSPYFDLFKSHTKAKILSFGFDSSSDIWVEKKSNEESLVHFKKEEFTIKLGIPATPFHLLDSLAAIGAVSPLITAKEIYQKGLAKIINIPGRMEIILESPMTVIIDKANTYSTFKGIIDFVKNNFGSKIKRIIAVYGYFKEISELEREKMAELATNSFDLIVLTQDDPKDEPPEKGIEDFLRYAKKNNVSLNKYLTIIDRKEAIKTAIIKAKSNDLILILGRGNEQFLHYENKKIPFDDRVITRKILKEIGYLP